MAQLLFFGASITQGVGDSEGGWVDRLKRELHQQMFSEGAGERDEIFNLGIAGNTSAMVLTRMNTEIKARAWHEEPFAFVVCVGTNDSKATGDPANFVVTLQEYEQNLQQIVDSLRTYSEKILFVGLPLNNDKRTQPIGTSYFTQDRIGQFDAAIGKVARNNHLSKVEIFEPMLRGDWKHMLFSDGLHPNAKGHAFIADRVRPELWKLLGLSE